MIKPIAALALLLAAPARAADAPIGNTLHQRVEAVLAGAPPGTRFGMVVSDETGRELIAIAPEQRFIPASNTKILTTAAAYFALPAIAEADRAGGLSVRLGPGRRPDVILTGHGDARVSSAPDCRDNCLTALADAVAARTRIVGGIIGDATLMPDQRWSPGMSWNNIPTGYGTAIAALTLDSNELPLVVTPTAPGQAPTLSQVPYYEIENRAMTVASGETEIELERFPGSRILRVNGTIVATDEPEKLALGIDDPAWYAAWRFKSLLKARGVRVSGALASRYRPSADHGNSSSSTGAELARLTPPPLAEDIRLINKVSQNLHAELLLRRIGLAKGGGTIADARLVIRDMFDKAGAAQAHVDLSDGSGMSTYNRVAPRGMVRLLRWIALQPWGASWRSSLPVAGFDGTLRRRFGNSTLKGRLFAKTGSLNATSALSGYLLTASGRTLTFSIFANDVPDGASATKAMDAALELIAKEN